MGNVVGGGTLALPIVSGLCGYYIAIFGIIVIGFIMLVSGFVIIHCIDSDKKKFDMPSFYASQMGGAFKHMSILCNMIILYGVLIALLSGISTMIPNLFPSLFKYRYFITVIYFTICTGIILFGLKEIRSSMFFLTIIVWFCFFMMLVSGTEQFDYQKLNDMNYKYLPLCFPVAICAFHYHNVIPTVFKMLNNDKKSTYITISVGVIIGLIINLVWITVVLGTVPVYSADNNNIIYSFRNGLYANAPMAHILKLGLFTTFSTLFSILTTTTSFLTTGAGLYGYMEDIFYNKFNIDNKLLVAAVAFMPPLLITFMYPNLFIRMLSIVGGIGESMLFGILPAVVLLKINNRFKHKIHYGLYSAIKCVGYFMFIVSSFVFIYMFAKELGFINPNFNDIISRTLL